MRVFLLREKRGLLRIRHNLHGVNIRRGMQVGIFHPELMVFLQHLFPVDGALRRIFGRDVVEKLTSKSGLRAIDEFFERHGKQSILIARLLPFISFDFVSYAAGLTSMSFVGFFVATGIGQLPATIIYSYVGGMLTGGAKFVVMGLLILFSLSVLSVMLRQIYKERVKKRAEAGNGSAKQ